MCIGEKKLRLILDDFFWIIHASRNLECNLRISVKTRRDRDIIEMATANTRGDMNVASLF